MRSIHVAFFTVIAILMCAASQAQTDLAASVYGAFSGATDGNNIRQSPSNAAGALIEIRHISNPIFGLEATYAWNRANQNYRYTGPIPALCPSTGCPVIVPASVPNNAHEITADWVPSLKIGSFRPFGVLGLGALLDMPAGSDQTKSSIQAVYVYGAGLDWGVLPHMGLRFQYRGNLYKAPDLTTLYSSTDRFTHTAEPVIGVYLRL